MYFSGLHRAIKDLEEKRFYDIALLFLSAKGYQSLAIVDGTGDGGRDVTCSWEHVRIQLSVQRSWEAKINKEALAAKNAGRKHLVYVTNRRIRDTERESFIQSKYTEVGVVELTVFDLDSIATSLSMPGRIAAAYEILGFVVSKKLTATPQEIALSNTMLFSKEAKELRDNALESSLKSQLFEAPGSTEATLLEIVTKSYGTTNVTRPAHSALQRLLVSGEVQQHGSVLQLSSTASAEICAAKQDFLQAKTLDLNNLCAKYSLTDSQADQLVKTALEIQARRGDFAGDEAYEIRLTQLISECNLNRRKIELYEDLSRLTCAKIAQYGDALNHIFSTDTFDIFRALGRSTKVVALLDASVAMPLLFGLSFATAKSRYGIGASALHDLCQSHQISIKVPQPYLNEMASHGKKALELLATYDLLGEESKGVLRASGNAYISHYSHIRGTSQFADKLDLKQFLQHFGITPSAGLWSVENRLQTLLESFNIEVVSVPKGSEDIRGKIATLKRYDPAIIIDHDAAVCSYLKENTDAGFIFATWDYALTAIVESMSRIYADSPSRVVDFLSMSRGAAYETETTVSLLDSLIYCDERKVEALARKIEGIQSTELAFELQKFSDEARRANGAQVEADELLEPFFRIDRTSRHLSPGTDGDASDVTSTTDGFER